MTTKTEYYTKDELTTWERIKKAFSNDWEQTKADFGSNTARDMDQDVDDTIKQMVGSDDAFENREQAFRFGFTAQNRYKDKYPSWNKDLDTRLKIEFDGDYETSREYIRHAYDYPRSS
jgi:hypothetical protein